MNGGITMLQVGTCTASLPESVVRRLLDRGDPGPRLISAPTIRHIRGTKALLAHPTQPWRQP